MQHAVCRIRLKNSSVRTLLTLGGEILQPFNILSQHTLSAAAGLVCLVLIIIQGREKLKSKAVYRSTFIFALNIIAISLMLYFLYAAEVLLNSYNVPAPLRALDYMLYSAVPFTWLSLVNALCRESDSAFRSRWVIAGKALSAAGMAVFLIITVFAMNSTYYIESPALLLFYHLTEIIFAAACTAIIITCAFKALDRILLAVIRKYVMTGSVILSIYLLFQIPLCINLGTKKIAAWSSKDYSGWILLIINILTCWFIYKKDFQKLYSVPDSSVNEVDELTSRLDTTAQEYKLTHREREIIELVYKGLSNNEISAELCISLNTVKSHMRNIFEKAGVNTRMELTYIINSQKLRK